uniref:P25 n=1 Tax=Olivavirus actinidiae TaxID=2024724 RepID=A0A7L9CBW9_9CLOS|nr:P25 [Actinidia virus 1]
MSVMPGINGGLRKGSVYILFYIDDNNSLYLLMGPLCIILDNLDFWVIVINSLLLGLKMYCYLKSSVTVLLVLVIDSLMDTVFQLLNWLNNKYKNDFILAVAYISVMLTQLYPLHLVSMSLINLENYGRKNTRAVTVMVLSVLLTQIFSKIVLYIIGRVRYNLVENDSLIADQLYDILTTIISIIFFIPIIHFHAPVSNLLDYWGTIALVLLTLSFWLSNWYKRKELLDGSDVRDNPSSESMFPAHSIDELAVDVS